MASLDFSAWSPIYIFHSHLDDITRSRLEDIIIRSNGRIARQASDARTLLSKMTKWKRLRLDLRSQGIWMEPIGDSEVDQTGLNTDQDYLHAHALTVMSIDWVTLCSEQGRMVPVHSFIRYQGYPSKNLDEEGQISLMPKEATPDASGVSGNTDLVTPEEGRHVSTIPALTAEAGEQRHGSDEGEAHIASSTSDQPYHSDSSTDSGAGEALDNTTKSDSDNIHPEQTVSAPSQAHGQTVDLTGDLDRDIDDNDIVVPVTPQRPTVAPALVAGGHRQLQEMWPSVKAARVTRRKSHPNRQRRANRSSQRAEGELINLTEVASDDSDDESVIPESPQHSAAAPVASTSRTVSPEVISFVGRKRKQNRQTNERSSNKPPKRSRFDEVGSGFKAARTRAINTIENRWPGVDRSAWLPATLVPEGLLIDQEGERNVLATVPARDWDTETLASLAQVAKLASNSADEARQAMSDVAKGRKAANKTKARKIHEVIAVLKATKSRLQPRQPVLRSINSLAKPEDIPQSESHRAEQ